MYISCEMSKGKQLHSFESVTQAPFPDLAPVNLTPSPPKTRDKGSINKNQAVLSDPSGHDPLLAKHLGLGTNQLGRGLANMVNKKKGGPSQKASSDEQKTKPNRKRKSDRTQTTTDDMVAEDEGYDTCRPDKRRKRIEKIDSKIPEYLNFSKSGAQGAFVSHQGKVPVANMIPASSLSNLVDEDEFQSLEIEESSNELQDLSSGFDPNSLLPDIDLQEIYKESLGAQAYTLQPYIDHITDSIEAEDEELFETYINFPAEAAEDEFHSDEGLADEDLVEVTRAAEESLGAMETCATQALDDMDLEGSWLDELDQASIEMLSPGQKDL